MENLSYHSGIPNGSVPCNSNYKDDLRISLQLNSWALKSIGTWPRSLSGFWIETIWCRMLNVICYAVLTAILIPCSMYIVLEIKDFYNQLKLGSALSFFIMAAMKYCALIIREGDIRRCIEHVENDWRNVRYKEDREMMLENASFGRRLMIICILFMYGGLLFYYIALPLTGKLAEDGNVTYRKLVFPVPKVIVDARRSPVNEIFFCIQLMCGVISHTITVAACGLAALLAMHACGQLQVLVSWLNHLVDGREGVNETLDERLAHIIRLHVRILNFISLTEELLHEISLVEVVGCTLNICFLGYYCMMEWDFKQPISGLSYLILLISLTFNIFIFCYIGELVTEQVTKVCESSYMIDWYRMPGRKSLAVILIICMSNATAKLTAGNLIELSISSFGDVIKSSLAYLNMLRTFTT